jgi:hypothetical protein
MPRPSQTGAAIVLDCRATPGGKGALGGISLPSKRRSGPGEKCQPPECPHRPYPTHWERGMRR